MNDPEKEKIQQYRRQRLEPEIAAMSVESSEDENPTLIVNIDDPTAKGTIKKVIIWLGGLAGLGEILRWWSRRSPKEQMAAAMAGTAAVATIATAAVTPITRDDGDTSRPPVVAERVVTLPPEPPVTVTASPRPSKTAPRESPPASPAPAIEHPARPTRSEQPLGGGETARTRTPAPSPSPRRSTKPPTRDAPPSTAQPIAESDSPRPNTTAPTSPSAPTTQPEPEPEPTVAALDCVVEVDLDPLLDLCLLG